MSDCAQLCSNDTYLLLLSKLAHLYWHSIYWLQNFPRMQSACVVWKFKNRTGRRKKEKNDNSVFFLEVFVDICDSMASNTSFVNGSRRPCNSFEQSIKTNNLKSYFFKDTLANSLLQRLVKTKIGDKFFLLSFTEAFLLVTPQSKELTRGPPELLQGFCLKGGGGVRFTSPQERCMS